MIISLWGIEGSGKSSIALTFPKPLFHMDLDLGGFDRAAWRIIDEAKKDNVELRIKYCEPREDISKIDWDAWDIVTKPYPVPIQANKLMGVPAAGKDVTVRFPRKVIGVKEVWQDVVADFMSILYTEAVLSIVPDSATQLWWICHTGLLQEKQEIQIAQGIKETAPNFREKLQPVEFPNDRMFSLIHAIRGVRKNLIMTHYPKDVYKERVGDRGVETYNSGEITLDGFKHTVKNDDIVLWCYTEIDKRKEIIPGAPNPNYNKPQPYAKIDLKCGLNHLGMSAVGLELPTPSYEGLMELQKLVAGEE